MIRQLKEEIEKLKQQVLAGGSHLGVAVDDAEMKKKIAEMEDEQKNAWEEKER